MAYEVSYLDEIMSIALVVFAKTPGLSSYKTRLAKTVGAEITETFYKSSLLATKSFGRDLKNHVDSQLDFFIAVAEPAAIGHPCWDGDQLIVQSQGNLAQRQSGIYSELLSQFDAVFFMGADSPHLDSSYIGKEISSFLKSDKDFILGPADDGGYYLFGGKKALSLESWDSVEYSKEDTCNELAKVLKQQGELGFIGVNFDIDDIGTLKKMSQIDLQGLTDEQNRLISWSKTISYDAEIP